MYVIFVPIPRFSQAANILVIHFVRRVFPTSSVTVHILDCPIFFTSSSVADANLTVLLAGLFSREGEVTLKVRNYI